MNFTKFFSIILFFLLTTSFANASFLDNFFKQFSSPKPVQEVKLEENPKTEFKQPGYLNGLLRQTDLKKEAEKVQKFQEGQDDLEKLFNLLRGVSFGGQVDNLPPLGSGDNFNQIAPASYNPTSPVYPTQIPPPNTIMPPPTDSQLDLPINRNFSDLPGTGELSKNSIDATKLTDQYLTNNRYGWLYARAVTMYYCNKVQTETRYCGCSKFGYYAFDCQNFCGIGVQQAYLKKVYGSVEAANGARFEIRLFDPANKFYKTAKKKCAVVPVVDTGIHIGKGSGPCAGKNFVHNQNCSFMDITACVWRGFGVGDAGDMKVLTRPLKNGEQGCDGVAENEKFEVKKMPNKCENLSWVMRGGRCVADGPDKVKRI